MCYFVALVFQQPFGKWPFADWCFCVVCVTYGSIAGISRTSFPWSCALTERLPARLRANLNKSPLRLGRDMLVQVALSSQPSVLPLNPKRAVAIDDLSNSDHKATAASMLTFWGRYQLQQYRPQLSVGEETAEEANVVFVMHDEAHECHAFCPELSKAGNDDWHSVFLSDSSAFSITTDSRTWISSWFGKWMAALNRDGVESSLVDAVPELPKSKAYVPALPEGIWRWSFNHAVTYQVPEKNNCTYHVPEKRRRPWAFLRWVLDIISNCFLGKRCAWRSTMLFVLLLLLVLLLARSWFLLIWLLNSYEIAAIGFLCIFCLFTVRWSNLFRQFRNHDCRNNDSRVADPGELKENSRIDCLALMLFGRTLFIWAGVQILFDGPHADVTSSSDYSELCIRPSFDRFAMGDQYSRLLSRRWYLLSCCHLTVMPNRMTMLYLKQQVAFCFFWRLLPSSGL